MGMLGNSYFIFYINLLDEQAYNITFEHIYRTFPVISARTMIYHLLLKIKSTALLLKQENREG